eukprot:GILK01001524.1.p1 GENE.GILK01001524.1~~GILK01001524.1.p1  ORF type:complete len:377 (-),score=56.07 GILK01001524.1:172-1302(-)
MPYISAQGIENLKKYTYKGGDLSLIYKHILSPLNDYLVEYFPRWLAPNTITLAGLACVITSHIVMAYYAPDLQGVAPSWVYYMCAVCLISYQTLDNLDGKQARRTGTSSPLGLLFDHGCDAVNCTISSMTMMSTLQVGPNYLAVIMWAIATVPFFFATWEEYFTGGLYLPIVNGPTEGLFAVAFLYVFTGWKGAAYWAELNDFGFPNSYYVFVPFAISSAFTTFYNIVNVYNSCKEQKVSMVSAMKLSVPLLGLITVLVLWVATSPVDVIAHYPRLTLWLVGLLFSKLVTHLMIAHVSHSPYQPFRKTLLPLFVVGANSAYAFLFKTKAPIDELYLLIGFVVLSILTYLHLIVSVVGQMTEALNINCFTIKKKNKE